jgi:hypothetical protein
MRDEPDVELRCLTIRSSRSLKRCWFIGTAGRWPWKSEPAKECVTTHLPNGLALKMDGAEASDLYSTLCVNAKHGGVGGRGLGDEVEDVSPDETEASADLGGSSKYSNENFED